MLTTHDLPALFAKNPSPSLSKRYGFVSSEDIMNLLGEKGWTARQGFYTKPRKSDTSNPLYRKHIIRYHNPVLSAEYMEANNGDRPEIVVTNSHNGSSSVVFEAGIFRMVCSNGLIMSSREFGGLRLRHDNELFKRDDTFNALSNIVQALTNTVPQVAAAVPERWSKIHLAGPERLKFYKKAAALRNVDMFDTRYSQFDDAKRVEDLSDDLWTTFNRTQEYIIRGGFRKHHDFAEDSMQRKIRELGPVTAVDKLRKFNTELWDMAMATEVRYLEGEGDFLNVN